MNRSFPGVRFMNRSQIETEVKIVLPYPLEMGELQRWGEQLQLHVEKTFRDDVNEIEFLRATDEFYKINNEIVRFRYGLTGTEEGAAFTIKHRLSEDSILERFELDLFLRPSMNLQATGRDFLDLIGAKFLFSIEKSYAIFRTENFQDEYLEHEFVLYTATGAGKTISCLEVEQIVGGHPDLLERVSAACDFLGVKNTPANFSLFEYFSTSPK